MRIILQRVSRAQVSIDGEVVGRIGPGLLLLVGFTEGDDEEKLRWMADKVIGLRVFNDPDGKMNLSMDEMDGSILAVSQFNDRFLELLRERAPGPVESGEFGAMMDVELVNDGPVTLVLER